MSTPWYNDKKGIERCIKEAGLMGLNAVADERYAAHYKRDESLAEFVLLGYYCADTCGNWGIIQWEDKIPNATSSFSVFPLVATRD